MIEGEGVVMKKFRQLQYIDRLKLERFLKNGYSKKDIAVNLGVCIATVYNELKRGEYDHLLSDYTTEKRYSPQLAQAKYEEGLKSRGTSLKIGNDLKLANYIEDKIVKNGYSPEAVIGEIEAKDLWNEFNVKICTKTVYNYIDKHIFLLLTNKHLPAKRNKKQKYQKIIRRLPRQAGDNIEKRPAEILKREEFGHWEMDTVKGQLKKSKNSLLVLTERKTRREIILKLSDLTAKAVVKALDSLERKWGEIFKSLFKTITVDNGVEFSLCEAMEKSIYKGKRTKLYYCHPYSSCERGSNENANKLIRRKIPKGTNFDNKTDEEIEEIEKWINSYPRRIHKFKNAEELFNKELAMLKA